MVYIHSWQEYQDAAEALYSKSPNKVCGGLADDHEFVVADRLVGQILCQVEGVGRKAGPEDYGRCYGMFSSLL